MISMITLKTDCLRDNEINIEELIKTKGQHVYEEIFYKILETETYVLRQGY